MAMIFDDDHLWDEITPLYHLLFQTATTAVPSPESSFSVHRRLVLRRLRLSALHTKILSSAVHLAKNQVRMYLEEADNIPMMFKKDGQSPTLLRYVKNKLYSLQFVLNWLFSIKGEQTSRSAELQKPHLILSPLLKHCASNSITTSTSSISIITSKSSSSWKHPPFPTLQAKNFHLKMLWLNWSKTRAVVAKINTQSYPICDLLKDLCVRIIMVALCYLFRAQFIPIRDRTKYINPHTFWLMDVMMCNRYLLWYVWHGGL